MADIWSWQEQLAKAHLKQWQVGEFVGLDKTAMSLLVKKMISGEGKTATELDKRRWQQALDFIDLKQRQLQEI